MINHALKLRVSWVFFQQMVEGMITWRRLYCVLRGGKLYCFYTPEEIEAKVEPTLIVSINKVNKMLF